MRKISFEDYLEICRWRRVEKYQVYMLDDDIHDARFVAGCIMDFFADMPIDRAYYIAMGTNYLGSFPLYSTDSKDKVSELQKYLMRFHIDISIQDTEEE